LAKLAKAHFERRLQQEDELVLNVLHAVENDPTVTQRSVANGLGIALGLANAYLRRCIRKGLIKVNQVPRRRFAYYLTPQGFSEKSRLTANYLSRSLSFFRDARMQCGELFEKAVKQDQRRLALVGEGELAEIAMLVARDYPVEILGVVPVSDDEKALREQFEALGKIDGLIVTALSGSSEVFASCVRIVGASRVYAPALLGVRSRPTMEDVERVS
jgi:hypothetical protein